MKHSLVALSLLTLLVACGKDGKNGADGVDGASIHGVNGVSTGVDFEDIAPGLACAAGGVSVFTFRDDNADGVMQSSESVVKIKAICNGTNGANGANGADGANGVDGTNGTNATLTLESIAAGSSCPTGGVRISSNTSPAVEICNGANGLNGEQGIQGVQGIPGIAGSNGTNGRDGVDGTQVIPVKFCPGDNSTFPEYGLMIGSELFAVYWGTTPASPNVPQAFLAKLVAGNYRSTGGNNCLFSVQ